MAKRTVAVIDAETDPFLFGRVPKPFCWGFYDGKTYVQFWSTSVDDCTRALLGYLESRTDPLTIYAHNGGKFDFLFFVEHLNGKIRIVNGRILEATIFHHTIRDSYAILPIPLSKLEAGKKEISYKLMEKEVREQYKDEILDYLKHDCIGLWNVVDAFLEQFGDKLTIGGAAMSEFQKFHKFDRVNASFDSFVRQYYFGGRCQCFEVGVIEADIKVYDINSAYPDAMDKIAHPIGNRYIIDDAIGPTTAFVCWEGFNDNAVPVRTKDGLDFAVKSGTFWTTIHEFNAGLETGLIAPKRIKHTVNFDKWMVFGEFVQYFYESRKIAKKQGDKFKEIFYKLILNSAYGKFAQSPENYVDSIILPWGETPGPEYYMEFRHDAYAIWSKPTAAKTYYNVATAASITGAVRSTLLRGLAASTRPLYCDTDSIFCEAMCGDMDDSRLGAWKHEADGRMIAIAGKKLYALVDESRPDVWNSGEWKRDHVVKLASKGVRLPAEAIFTIARGDTVETRNDAPTFKLGGKVTYDEAGEQKRVAAFEHQFIQRSVKRTTLPEIAL